MRPRHQHHGGAQHHQPEGVVDAKMACRNADQSCDQGGGEALGRDAGTEPGNAAPDEPAQCRAEGRDQHGQGMVRSEDDAQGHPRRWHRPRRRSGCWIPIPVVRQPVRTARVGSSGPSWALSTTAIAVATRRMLIPVGDTPATRIRSGPEQQKGGPVRNQRAAVSKPRFSRSTAVNVISWTGRCSAAGPQRPARRPSGRRVESGRSPPGIRRRRTRRRPYRLG